jgi:hypothetical protein
MKSFPLFLLILLLLSLGGCSPAAKLRRAQKLIEKAEAGGAKWTVDTVYVKIPVIVPETRVDSIFMSLPGDTVVLEKDRLKVIYVRLAGDSVYIDAECDSIVIEKEVPVTVTKTIHAPKGKIKWWWLIIAGCVGGFITLIVTAFRR